MQYGTKMTTTLKQNNCQTVEQPKSSHNCFTCMFIHACKALSMQVIYVVEETEMDRDMCEGDF